MMTSNVVIGLRDGANRLRSETGPEGLVEDYNDIADTLDACIENEQLTDAQVLEMTPDNGYKYDALQTLFGFYASPGDHVPAPILAAYAETSEWIKSLEGSKKK